MRVMVVEADGLMADLFGFVVEGLHPGTQVCKASRLSEALDLWRSDESRPDAVICDLSLPDGSGMELVREVRRTNLSLPLMVVTSRTDRASVIAAAREKVSAYITKPFNVELVRERLTSMLFPAGAAEQASSSQEDQLDVMLERVSSEGVHFSSGVPLHEVHDLRERAESLSIPELGEALAGYPEFHASLIGMANGQMFRRGSVPVTSMLGALQVLGLRVALDVALVSALDSTSNLQDALLKDLAAPMLEQSERIAMAAVMLGRQAGIDENGCFAAGMLHKAGELCVLTVAQQYVSAGGSLDEETVARALQRHSVAIAARLKIKLRLPVFLKQMIGATYALPSGATDMRLSLMRTAALLAGGREQSPECQKLMRRLGVTENPLASSRGETDL